MDLITTGLGAGSYPEPKGKRTAGRSKAQECWLLYPEFFQEFSDMQEFSRSFEGETWQALGEREQREILRNSMRIYSSAWDCDRWKKEYLKRHRREYGEYLKEAGILGEEEMG